MRGQERLPVADSVILRLQIQGPVARETVRNDRELEYISSKEAELKEEYQNKFQKFS